MDPDDIDDMDFDLPAGIASLALSPSAASTAPQQQQQPPLGVAQARRQQLEAEHRRNAAAMKEASKTWTCIYPIYLSPTGRSHRKIPLPLCPPQPAAIYIAEAVAHLRLPLAIEREARHPADPLVFGRIKVQLRDPTTRAPLNPSITSKRQLVAEIAKYYAGCEMKINQDNPQARQIALASRSALSSEVGDMSGTVGPAAGSAATAAPATRALPAAAATAQKPKTAAKKKGKKK